MSTNSIDVAECKRLMEEGRRLSIIDVRTLPEFARVHAAGAESIPLDDLNVALLKGRRPDPMQPIYLICQSGQRAAKAWQRLFDAGVDQIYVIRGGTTAWEQAGLPVECGKTNVISLERQVRISAGLLILLGSLLTALVHPLFVIIPIFVGAGLVFAGVTDRCGMAMALTKMPWNRGSATRCRPT